MPIKGRILHGQVFSQHTVVINNQSVLVNLIQNGNVILTDFPEFCLKKDDIVSHLGDFPIRNESEFEEITRKVSQPFSMTVARKYDESCCLLINPKLPFYIPKAIKRSATVVVLDFT